MCAGGNSPGRNGETEMAVETKVKSNGQIMLELFMQLHSEVEAAFVAGDESALIKLAPILSACSVASSLNKTFHDSCYDNRHSFGKGDFPTVARIRSKKGKPGRPAKAKPANPLAAW